MYPTLQRITQTKAIHSMNRTSRQDRIPSRNSLNSKSVRSKEEEIKATLVSMMPQLIPLFPNLVTLSLLKIYHPDLLNFAGTLTSLRLINVDILPAPMPQNLSNLTRLELGNNWGGPPGCSALLKMAASTIEHVKLFALQNYGLFRSLPDIIEHNAIVFPIMGKLRDFEVMLNPTGKGYREPHVTPCICLKFEGADSFRRLDYEVQFPVLEMIKISREDICGYRSTLTEQEYFETGASFLYNSFLHESNSRGRV
ncbi:uncharacterized protein LOC118433244 [Folsomia candida]|uniref:uncharacterized protein LOC118433244 n=1 Tax=Folsomia candida TaxID=158441 RepID=UPI001604BE26|nr:uncharacterized protein LOC118433244 [Folsomia candida]